VTFARTETDRTARGAWVAAIVVVAALSLAFQGSRGLWEPDEGFYSNAALDMARTGSWLVPRVNGVLFLDKPPLQYWGMAAGVALLGPNEWGLRLANVVWNTLAAIAVGALAGRMWGRRRRAHGTLAYGVMLAPFLATDVLTPDTPLACCVAFLGYAYWRSSEATAGTGAIAWEVVAGSAAGMAALAKGPAVLVFVAPVLLHAALAHGWRRALRTCAVLSTGTGLAAAFWYAPVLLGIPGAAAYLWDNQVWGRLASSHYQRNAGWVGPIKVYLPMLLVGTLPWTGRLAHFAKDRIADARRARPWSSAEILLTLQVVVPFAVLSLARSRLPLYALPAMAPVAVLAAAGPLRPDANARTARRSARLRVASWVVALLAAKAFLSLAPIAAAAPLDSRALAANLRSAGVRDEAEVVVVDQKRNGLTAYGYPHLTWTRHLGQPYPFFRPPEVLGSALAEIAARRPAQVALVVRDADRAAVLANLPEGLSSCEHTVGGGFVVLDCAEAPDAGPGSERDPALLSSAGAAIAIAPGGVADGGVAGTAGEARR